MVNKPRTAIINPEVIFVRLKDVNGAIGLPEFVINDYSGISPAWLRIGFCLLVGSPLQRDPFWGVFALRSP